MKKNNVLIFPTDTVYGIGASVYDSLGQDRIYEIKHRPLDKPLAVLCANIDQINEICFVSDDAKKLIKEFLPGPLTLILKVKEVIKDSFRFDTVGVRIPNNSLAISILKNEGPMATTSVNESGEKPINNYSEIKEIYDDYVDGIYPPNGEGFSKVASTVVNMTSSKPKIVRQGTITIEMIDDCLKK